MRVLFFGTSAFAVPTLDTLHEASDRHLILGVVTQPDRPSGRGMQLHPSPVKRRALELGYPVFQPERVRRKPFPAEVAAMAPEALVVISFGQIIPQAMLEQPRFGGVNVHASLLPRWRGAAPIHHAIMAGDRDTGVATLQMEATLDTGPVYLEAREPILPGDTVGSLEPRLAALGGPLLVQTLDRMERGAFAATPQREEGMVYAPPVTREMGFLNLLEETAVSLERRVRGTSPRPGAFLVVAGRTLKVLEAAVAEGDAGSSFPGTVSAVLKEGLVVRTAQGDFLLRVIQPENKGAMRASDWARGARIQVGDPARAPEKQL
ncbi:MAG: methionyl-tRNA formyltransferase [Cytophagales bacterium]|nr:methionyl-tRNA formyltransferase [Armatimonadota bacterium]